jgi:hypothetical protein
MNTKKIPIDNTHVEMMFSNTESHGSIVFHRLEMQLGNALGVQAAT